MRFRVTRRTSKTGGVSDFHRALTQEIMGTELLRIKAVIATAVVLGRDRVTVYFFAPDPVSRGSGTAISRRSGCVPFGPFILFEWWVLGAIQRHCGATICHIPGATSAR